MGHHSPGQQCQGLNPSPHTQQVSVHHTHLHRNPTPTPSFLRRPQRARTGSPYRLLLPAAPLSAAPTPGCPGAMLALPGRPRATLSRAGRGAHSTAAHSTAAHSSVPPALGAPLLRWHGRPLPAPAPQPPLRVQTELRPDGRSRGGAAARRAGRRAVPGAGGMGPPGEQRGAGAAGDLAALAELDEAALLGALRDRFLRQQIYVSAGAGRGAWGSALPSRLSPHRSPLIVLPPRLQTDVGDILIAVNPFQPLQLYGREVSAALGQPRRVPEKQRALVPRPRARPQGPVPSFRSPSGTGAMRRARCLRTSSPWPTAPTKPCWAAAEPGPRANASSSGEERARPRGRDGARWDREWRGTGTGSC